MTEPTGYTKLARFMDTEKYTIFRQFKVSATRDLLFLQAELTHLENDFLILADRDRKSEHEASHDRNWEHLSTSGSRGFDGEQWTKALEIRAKLKEYYECISQYSEVLNLPKARKRDVALLSDWINSPDLGGGILFTGEDLSLTGTSVYDDSFSADLMILHNRVGENDWFSRFLAGPVFHRLARVLEVFKSPVRHDSEGLTRESNLFTLPDSQIIGIINVLGTALASMTPLFSIIVLYFVRNLGARLAVLCACTFVFSCGLAVVTKARRIEVFACTAAFAGVQVVFVGSTNNCGV